MMNQLLGKHKETSKRFLNFTVPRVVAVSPQMRLVEDNPSSVSDIYLNKKYQILSFKYNYFKKIASTTNIEKFIYFKYDIGKSFGYL